jgi:hypothetical protein
MTEIRIAGEPLDLIEAAFRGMQARRDDDGWVSISGRLDPVPGEALMRALRATEVELPRRLGSTRDEHRAAALDEIVRQVTLLVGHVPGDTPAEGEPEQAQLFPAPDAKPREKIVRADEAIDDAFAGGRVRGRADRPRHPAALRLVKTPNPN